MKVSELIELLLTQYRQDADVVADIWTSSDICNASGLSLNDNQCKVVISYLNDNLDSEYGINNERVKRIVSNLIEDGEIDIIGN